jgi:hypothetical protein
LFIRLNLLDNRHLPNVDLGLWAKIFQQATQLFLWHGDAAGGGRQARACEMQEDCASAAGNARARVVVDFDNEIIEMIIPPQPVSSLSRRQPDRPVVAAVGRVLAPGVCRRYAPDR